MAYTHMSKETVQVLSSEWGEYTKGWKIIKRIQLNDHIPSPAGIYNTEAQKNYTNLEKATLVKCHCKKSHLLINST